MKYVFVLRFRIRKRQYRKNFIRRRRGVRPEKKSKKEKKEKKRKEQPLGLSSAFSQQVWLSAQLWMFFPFRDAPLKILAFVWGGISEHVFSVVPPGRTCGPPSELTHFHLAFSPLACTCIRASSFSETSRLRAKKSGVYLSTNNLKPASSTRKPQNVFALKRFWQQVLTNSLHNLQTEPDRIQVHASDGAALLRGS